MDCERESRTLQEQKLPATAGAGRHVIDAMAIRRFVMHYVRLTLHHLLEMFGRANVILPLMKGMDSLTSRYATKFL
jgi:hypothetical protein